MLLLVAAWLAAGQVAVWLVVVNAGVAVAFMGLGISWFVQADSRESGLAATGDRLSVTSANVFGSAEAAVAAAGTALADGVDVLALLEVGSAAADCADAVLEGYERAVSHPVGGAGVVIWVKGGGPDGEVVPVGQHGGVAGVVEVTGPAGRAVTVVAVHPIAPKFSAASLVRHADEMSIISNMVSLLAGPVVLVGDFNASDRAPSMRSLVSETCLVDAHRVAGSGLGHTWGPGGRLYVLRIDHALVSQELSVADCYAADVVASDHRSVTVEVV
jgi:endonuclease/exonuclease/phosphatase (EEP) superfamily protein YafD